MNESINQSVNQNLYSTPTNMYGGA